ncbi:MAG: hypothetical protein JOZ41_11570 [Chloroflexi bacterium]|nr:hypothetical protein [Chloroflexota bacterium]
MTDPAHALLPPLDPAALHGLSGEVVRTIEPHTGADRGALWASLLPTALVFSSAAVGHRPHALADGSRHALNVFAVLVGNPVVGRKGSSLAWVRRLFAAVDPD